MTCKRKMIVTMALALAACLQVVGGDLALAQPVPATATAPAGARAGRGAAGAGQGLTARVQDRTYVFKDTNENMPYAVFVSSQVTKEKKAPLVVALRGANGNARSLLVASALQQAEDGGYIMVGVMGYASMGGFGMDMSSMGARGGGGTRGPRGGAPATAPGTAPATAAATTAAASRAAAPAARGGAARGGAAAGGTAVTDSAKMSEMSEKDVLYVLEIMQKEFNVDERRTYLVGHSLGGGGAIFLGEKYADKFAGVVALSPGIFGGFQFTEKSKYMELPLAILVGANDTMIASVQQWEEKIKAAKIPHEYKEVPGFDHGGIISGGMAETFAFLAKQTKGEKRVETKPEAK